MGGCSTGMRGCGAACGHRKIVEGYREERQRLEQQAEDASLGYATELRDWLRDNPIGTFKDYLIQTKRAPVSTVDTSPGFELSDAARFLTFDNPAEANEAGLLGCAMFSSDALPALRALDTDKELLAHPSHPHVARAILDLADGKLSEPERRAIQARSVPGELPHNAANVTALLRERNLLPIEWNPQVPMRTVNPAQYGLGAWESYALPPQAAASFAMETRTAYRAHYLEDLCVRGASYARGVAASESGLTGIDLVGEARTRIATELINFPPELGPDLKPVKSGSSSQAVDTGEVARQATALRSPVSHTQDLRMPPRPQLSSQSVAILSRRGG